MSAKDTAIRVVFFSAAICIVFIPSEAFAWGPAVHLYSASQLLSGSLSVSPSLLDLLRNHANDFLYGALAADFIIGKKHAKLVNHCHNWDIGRSLLREARIHGSHREAFMLGYINHLGADVIAHNYTVPQMTVLHFAAKGIGHVYWEARADWRILRLHPELRNIWRELAALKFPGHDRFLWNNVVPTLFSNKLSAHIYKSNLVLQRNRVWLDLLRHIDETSKLKFDQAQLLLWINLAIQSGARASDNPWSRRLDRLDPIGTEALAKAEQHRQKLRGELKRPGRFAPIADLLEAATLQSTTVDLNHFEEDWM